MTTLDLSGVPFECHAYFVHLHGLEVEETLAKKLEDKKFFDPKINQYLSPEFLGGFTSFIGKYSGFSQWVPQLGFKKNKAYMLERFQHSESYQFGNEIMVGGGRLNLSRALRFLDDDTVGGGKNVYSLILVHPQEMDRLFPNILDRSMLRDIDTTRQATLEEIKIIVQMLRILGHRIIAPFISNVPFSKFFQYQDSKQVLKIAGLDDSEVRRSFVGSKKELTFQDLEWIKENFSWFWNSQYEDDFQSFNTTLEMITNYIYCVDPKVRFSTAWSGLEALLKPRSPLRKNMIKRMIETKLINKKDANSLWHLRNKVIHGDLSKEESAKVPERAELLHNLLCASTKFMIENKIFPTTRNLDERFGLVKSLCDICGNELTFSCPSCKTTDN